MVMGGREWKRSIRHFRGDDLDGRRLSMDGVGKKSGNSWKSKGQNREKRNGLGERKNEILPLIGHEIQEKGARFFMEITD